MNILEDLYFGNIHPSDACFDPHSEYAVLMKLAVENEEKLTAFLKDLKDAEEQQHLFSQLMNAQSEVSAFTERNSFIEGFQLGARFMLDTFLLPQKSVVRDIH